MALSFTREDGVAIDKLAGVACPNLSGQRTCTIYPERVQRGFSICARYECFGAGQRVTQELFAGNSWRDDPSLTVPMTEAFAHMRIVHDALVLIAEGRKLPLSDEERSKLDGIAGRLDPLGGWTQKTLANAPVAAWTREIAGILRDAHRRTGATQRR